MKNVGASHKTLLKHELEENLCEMWAVFGRGPGCSLHKEDNLIWFETPIPLIPYNGVLRFNVQDKVDQTIGRIVDHFHQRKTPFMWILHPSSSPSDLGDRLLRSGLSDIEPITGMARSLEDLSERPSLPDDVEIRKVASASDASTYYQFAAWRWHVPERYQEHYAAIAAGFQLGEPGSKAHMWQAWRGGQPIAKAGMLFASNSAGIYAVVTRPEARGQGLARALTLTALHEARSSGFSLAVLHATPMAVNLYRSIGFEPIADFRLFASEEAYV